MSYQFYPLLLHSDTWNRTRMKMRELTLREKQAIWIQLELYQKQRAWGNQEFGNNQRHQQPTTTWLAEKTTVVDNRQIIKKTVKMNPKRRVCKIINFQKAGVMLWQSNVLYWDFDTELQMYPARSTPLTSTKLRKPRLEFAKKHKGEPEEFWNRWDKDEPLSKWWESKSIL